MPLESKAPPTNRLNIERCTKFMRESVSYLANGAQIVPDGFADQTQAIHSCYPTRKCPHRLIVAKQFPHLLFIIYQEIDESVLKNAIEERGCDNRDCTLVYSSALVE